MSTYDLQAMKDAGVQLSSEGQALLDERAKYDELQAEVEAARDQEIRLQLAKQIPVLQESTQNAIVAAQAYVNARGDYAVNRDAYETTRRLALKRGVECEYVPTVAALSTRDDEEGLGWKLRTLFADLLKMRGAW